MNIYDRFTKRILDVVFSIILIIVLSPLFAAISILVLVKLGSPVIFRHDRPGKQERIFTLYKYRTMIDSKSIDGKKLPDEERLTKFGERLRRTSLDELPELINILKGDMSFVGPRPLLVEYLRRYNEDQAKRHHVRPGLTGLAQINGRNAITWEQKFDYDCQYVNKVSFGLDLSILIKTIPSVLAKKGISETGQATMSEFKGNGEL